MMNLLKKSILLGLMWPALSWGALNLAEPEVLLKKATQSRTALLDVLLDIEYNIPEMRDPDTFDKYFTMLDALEVQSSRTGLEQYYPKIVSNVGLKMVSNGMRWLDVTAANTEKVAYYIKWMDADALARFMGLIEYQNTMIKNPVHLKQMADNIESILPVIDEKAASLPYVQLGFRRLVSDSAVALLKTEMLNEAEVDFWIKKIKIASSFSEYLDYLNQGIYSFEKDNKADSHTYIARLSLMFAQSAALSQTAPNWLINGIGDSLSEVLLRMVRLEETFRPGEFEKATAYLKSRHLQGLAQQWMAAEKLPSGSYIETYLAASRHLISRLQSSGLRKEADDLQKWLTKSAAPALARKVNLEGHYQLTSNTGEIWFFTVAVAKENTLIAALADAKGHVYKTFFNIAYNLKKDGFIASEREPDLDKDSNPPIEFIVSSDGKIFIYDPFARNQSRSYTGNKVQSFTDLWQHANTMAPLADGIYEGVLFNPSGTEMKSRLIITTFNGYTLGRLEFDSVSIELNIGTSAEDGVIIMTSGLNRGASWFQLRGLMTDEGIKAYVIVGGKGQGTACTLLKKIQ